MTALWVILAIALLAAIGALTEHQKNQNARIPFGERYCTKHTMQEATAHQDERLVDLYGMPYHHTRGRQCDGGLHHRSVWWF
jgi:hypothetical protein